MWENNSELVYHVIPSLSDVNYFQFALNYFHVPWDDNHIRIIMGPSQIALHTATGSSFVPNACHYIGFNPKVCRPIEETTISNCAVDLISQRDIPNCRAMISARGNKTGIFRLSTDSDEVIVAAYVTLQVILRCPDTTPIILSLTGPNWLIIPNGYSSEMPEWHLSGIESGRNIVNLPSKSLLLYSENIHHLATSSCSGSKRKLQLNERAEISLVHVEGWQPIEDASFDWADSRETAVYIIIGLASAAGILVIVAWVTYKTRCAHLHTASGTEISSGVSDIDLPDWNNPHEDATTTYSDMHSV